LKRAIPPITDAVRTRIAQEKNQSAQTGRKGNSLSMVKGKGEREGEKRVRRTGS